jgi:hypothetical protein
MNLREFFAGADLLEDPMNLGPLDRGHYIQIGLGTGFYIPECDYQAALTRANDLHQVQFVGVTKGGQAIHGTHEEIHGHPESAGVIAWIMPGGAKC